MAKTYRRHDPDGEDDDDTAAVDDTGVLRDGRSVHVRFRDHRPGPAYAYARRDARVRDRERYAETDIDSSCSVAGSQFGSQYFGAPGRVAYVGNEILCVPNELLETEDTMTDDANNVRMLIKDSNGNDTAGHRPGYVVPRNGARLMNDRAAKIRALEAYEQELQDAWRHPSPEQVLDEAIDTQVADAEAHRTRGQPRRMSDCYSDYDEKISELWKGNK